MDKHGNFGEALQAAKACCKVRRKSWKDGQYVFLQRGGTIDGVNDDGSVSPVVFTDNLMVRLEDCQTFEPYQPTQGDLMAEDWEVFEEGVFRMQPYVSTGIILAEAMSSMDPLVGLGRDPESEPMEGYHVIYPDGYESWCPAEQFEATHRKLGIDELGLLNHPTL
jgi:hypothetical protein